MRERPLSPHLGVYRFAYTMATSIFHRITGGALSVGLLLLVYWLMAAADGPEAYDSAMEVLMSGFGKLVIAGFVIAFAYHLCNGIRHLNWDLGRGLERVEARRSARIVVVATVLIAAIILLWAFGGGAA